LKTFFCNVSTLSDEELKEWYSAMSVERQNKCRRILSENGKKCCIAADHLLRTAIADWLRITPQEVAWKIAPSGKPYVEGNPVYISLSHSEYTVVCALSDAPVGIDIELNRPILTAVQERVCTPEERNYLNRAESDAEKSLRFLEIWTRKEAIFKLDGILPRMDREIPSLHPERLGIRVNTEKLGKYTLSVAELIV